MVAVWCWLEPKSFEGFLTQARIASRGFSKWPGIPCSMVAGFQEDTDQEPKEKPKDILWTSLGNHTASSTTFSSQGPSTYKGTEMDSIPWWGRRQGYIAKEHVGEEIVWQPNLGMSSTTACPLATKLHIPPTWKKTTHFLPKKSSPITASDSGLRPQISPSKSPPELLKPLSVFSPVQRPVN